MPKFNSKRDPLAHGYLELVTDSAGTVVAFITNWGSVNEYFALCGDNLFTGDTVAVVKDQLWAHLDSDPPTTDAQALDAVAALLSADQWSSDHLDAVADMIRATGREVADFSNAEAA